MIKLIADYFRCLSGNPSFISRVWSHFPAAKPDDVKRLFSLQDRPRLQPEIQSSSSSSSCSSSTHLTPIHPSTPQPSGRTSLLQRGFVATPHPHLQPHNENRCSGKASYLEAIAKPFFVFLAQTAKGRHQRGVLNVSESDAGVRATHSFIIAFNLTLIYFSPAAIHPVQQHPQSQPMASPTAGERLHPLFKFQNKSA